METVLDFADARLIKRGRHETEIRTGIAKTLRGKIRKEEERFHDGLHSG